MQVMEFNQNGSAIKVFFERIPDRLVILKTELIKLSDTTFPHFVAHEVLDNVDKQGLFLINKCPKMKKWLQKVRYRKLQKYLFD